MFKVFKAFIARGNVMYLAIGVIIGAAFTKIVTTLTEKMIMPVVGWIGQGFDVTQRYIDLLHPLTANSPEGFAKAVEEKHPIMMYGQFISDVVNFVIVAFIMFLLARWVVKYLNSLKAAAAPTPTESLLAEIRDLMKSKAV